MYHELWNASIVLLILGGLSALAGAVFRYYSHKNEPYRGHAEARVVDIVAVPRQGEASLSEFHNRIAAVFEFYAGGRPIKVVDSSDAYPCPYRINDCVQICYNPEEPQQYQVIRNNKWKLISSQCNVLTTLLVLGGCALFLIYAGRAGMS